MVIQVSVSINYWAVLVSGIVAMAIGAAWYSKSLFGKAWIKSSGMDEKKIKDAKKSGKVGKSYFISFIGTLLMAYILSNLIDYVGAKTIAAGMNAGFGAWLGFVAPVTISGVLWEGKPVSSYLIANGHYLITLLIMGIILAVWV